MPLVFVLLVCLHFYIYAQNENDYGETDKIALSIPFSQTNSTTDIAAYINNNFDTDNKKVRAIYIWLISHIKYSTDSIHRVILNEDRDQLITFALRRKKGVCENFAAIFDDICKKCGLQSFVVEGYTKQNSSVDKGAHAWNTVFIDNKWSLYDPTWDAGQPTSFYQPVNTIYFKISPAIFIQTHMPFDPLFQLLEYPLTYREFNNEYAKQKSDAVYFNYGDSMIKYEKADPLERYTLASLRIENNGASNNMINTKLSQLKMEVEIIYQVKDSILYNDAISDYNYATNTFNNFLTYRNSQFKPAKTDAEVQSIFKDIQRRITSARMNLEDVNKSKANLALDTGDLEFALNNLATHVKEQEMFLKNYMSASKDK